MLVPGLKASSESIEWALTKWEPGDVKTLCEGNASGEVTPRHEGTSEQTRHQCARGQRTFCKFCSVALVMWI